MSPTTKSTPASDGALLTISSLESTPITVASGQRVASIVVRLPVPQPRSTTVRGTSLAIRPIRSTKGLPRSSPKEA
jgi:hypothetical protein